MPTLFRRRLPSIRETGGKVDPARITVRRTDEGRRHALIHLAGSAWLAQLTASMTSAGASLHLAPGTNHSRRSARRTDVRLIVSRVRETHAGPIVLTDTTA